MDNHLTRPEVRQALATGVGTNTRRSDTVDQLMLYTAVPVQANGQTIGIARVAVPLSQIDAQVASLRRPLIAASLVAALLVFLLALFVAGRIARPVERLTAVADAIAGGDFSTRLTPTTQDEVGQLTRSFNKMANELDDKVSRLTEERSRLAAILENMADGVIITDTAGAVRLINTAATRLLNTTPSNALGRSFAQVVRHYQIIDLWQQCRVDHEPQIAPVEIDRQGIFWQVIITSFQEANALGYLVIIQDLSRIRRLETVRRDFISNISHELRTPLASLKALTETLRDGALDDPPAAERFLNSMETEIDALTQMVQELLELSRIEFGPGGAAPAAYLGGGHRVGADGAAAAAGRTLRAGADRRSARRPAPGAGRRRAHPAGRHQSGAQRDQVHSAGRPRHRARRGCPGRWHPG